MLEQSSAYKGASLERGIEDKLLIQMVTLRIGVLYCFYEAWWDLVHQIEFFYCFCHVNRNKTIKPELKETMEFYVVYFPSRSSILTQSLRSHSLRPPNHWKVQVQFHMMKTSCGMCFFLCFFFFKVFIFIFFLVLEGFLLSVCHAAPLSEIGFLGNDEEAVNSNNKICSDLLFCFWKNSINVL